jgi:hypothetical protein
LRERLPGCSGWMIQPGCATPIRGAGSCATRRSPPLSSRSGVVSGLGGGLSSPVAFALLWTWYNPRIFPAPQSLDHWMSKAVLGERVWLNRDVVPVPAYHRTVPNVLSAVAAIGLLFILWGVLMFDPWPTLFGTMMAYLGKLWFADRMVWIWNDMQDATPEYRSWRVHKEG